MSCVVAGLRYYFRIYKYEYLGELMTSELHISNLYGDFTPNNTMHKQVVLVRHLSTAQTYENNIILNCLFLYSEYRNIILVISVNNEFIVNGSY